MKISENQFAIASVTSIIGLLCIWVIPNTIALRHLLLVAGCLSALGLIRYNWARLKSVDARFLPLFCILGLFAWVLVHYTFFSLNRELELSEIKGLWMRSLVGAIAAVGIGIAIVKYAKLRLYFYLALFYFTIRHSISASFPANSSHSPCWITYHLFFEGTHLITNPL